MHNITPTEPSKASSPAERRLALVLLILFACAVLGVYAATALGQDPPEETPAAWMKIAAGVKEPDHGRWYDIAPPAARSAGPA